MSVKTRVQPGQLWKLSGGYTCSPDPNNEIDRFALKWFIGNEEDALVIVIAVHDFTLVDAPVYEQDDCWFLGLTSFGKFGWIPTGDATSIDTVIHLGV